MAIKQVGQANHVFKDKDISVLHIDIITPAGDAPFITIGNDAGESVIISSREQWAQVDALVLKAFDNLE